MVDMSPEAVGQRLRLMGELWELSVKLMNSVPAEPEPSIASLIDRFRGAAIEKDVFATPAKRDHKLYDVMAESYVALKRMGQEGEKALADLLNDESVHVRSWIATARMVEGDDEARKVLEEVALVDGLTGFNAKIALEEFDAGKLRDPFPDKG